MKEPIQEYVEFRKTRDLGRILGDAISFIKYERAPLFTAILRISIIPILMSIFSVVYYQIHELTDTGFVDGDNVLGNAFSNATELPYIFNNLIRVLAYAFISVSVFSYIKSYVANKGQINFSEIQKNALRKAFPLAGLSILKSIVILIGLVFLVVPGIYLAVVLTLAGSLLVFEDRDVFNAFGESFDFIRGYFWETFGTVLVAQLIVIVIGALLSIPVAFYGLGGLFQGEPVLKNFSTLASDPLYLGLIGLGQVLDLFLFVFIVVVMALIYFDILERKHPSKTDSMIDAIGTE
jgi:ABC-type multidrug transport system fused ATPase/permease subunit